ncbi:MAG: serine kinase [Rhodobacteraceae bacterium]|nr:serine kinase [Paracoccaceae bacterium]
MLTLENNPVYGSAIAVGGRGFLIRGASGSGKSGLVLQMMALGADLISDDQVIMERSAGTITMSAPQTLAGKIEARFVGILNVPSRQNVVLNHVIDLDVDSQAQLPQLQYCEVLGLRIDLINGRNVPNLASILMIFGRTERHC